MLLGSHRLWLGTPVVRDRLVRRTLLGSYRFRLWLGTPVVRDRLVGTRRRPEILLFCRCMVPLRCALVGLALRHTCDEIKVVGDQRLPAAERTVFRPRKLGDRIDPRV